MADQPEPAELTDPQAVRMLAHPLRSKIAELLRDGPASSTSLARALGESTGATSYHLRQLARYGFIEEVPELAKGRERWWRAVPGDRRFPIYSRQSPPMREAMDEYTRLEFANELEQLGRFQRARDALGPWGDALLFSHAAVSLRPDEVRPFFEDYIALLYRHRQPGGDDPPPDARTFFVRFLAFPEITEAEESAGVDESTGSTGTTGSAESEADAD